MAARVNEPRFVAKKAAKNEKMIEVKVRFWTNNMAGHKDKVRPRHAWASGVVRMERNNTHGVVPGKPIPFHSLMDLPAVVEKVLIKQGIVLHLNRRMRKYFSTPTT